MPTDSLSRYRHEAPHFAPDSSGASQPALPARWLEPRAGALVFHTLSAGESFETLAHQFLGSSALWWRIADANPLVFPLALDVGTVVAIPSGSSQPASVRTRNW